VAESADLFEEAEKIAELSVEYGSQVLVIGALALAAHNYVRTTGDIDLAGNLEPAQLERLAARLQKNGYEVELRVPDAEDPLGGVLDVHTPAGLIQIISFAQRFPAVIKDALQDARLVVRENSPLRIIPLPHLVVMKLYAGGFKSKLDVLEVLSRNPQENLDEISALCERYRIRGFSEIRLELEEQGQPPPGQA